MRLIVIRGVSGSGKSTLAEDLNGDGGYDWWEADMFFEVETKWGRRYEFDPKRLGDAHAWCQDRTDLSLCEGTSVIVSNTFTRRSEIEPYYHLAQEYGADFTVLTLEPGLSAEELAKRNLHGLSAGMIQKQLDRWEPWTIPSE
jgi:predicted kinase